MILHHLNLAVARQAQPARRATESPEAATIRRFPDRIVLDAGEGDDRIHVTPRPGGGVTVNVNGVSFFFSDQEAKMLEIHGGGGADSIHVEQAVSYDLVLSGGSGNDHIVGGAGDDHLIGGHGDDFLHGGLGNDVLDGDLLPTPELERPGVFGDDVLVGGDGDDILRGGDGKDSIIGGEGLDRVEDADDLDLIDARTQVETEVRGRIIRRMVRRMFDRRR